MSDKDKIDELVKHYNQLKSEIAKVVVGQDDVIEQHQIQIAKKHGFELTDHSLYLYGLCKDCH